MPQQHENPRNALESRNQHPYNSTMFVIAGGGRSFLFAIRQVLFEFVRHARGLFVRMGQSVNRVLQIFYAAAIRPAVQKMIPFFVEVNRRILSPVSQLCVWSFIVCVVKPLSFLAGLAQAAAQLLWQGARKVLAAILRSTFYQVFCKPYIARPLVKVARLLNSICVDFPAQVITWLFCAALAAVVQGGVKLSDVTSRFARGVRTFSAAVAKQMLGLYHAYDAFAIVPIDYTAQNTHEIKQEDVTIKGLEQQLNTKNERGSASEPVNLTPKSF